MGTPTEGVDHHERLLTASWFSLTPALSRVCVFATAISYSDYRRFVADFPGGFGSLLTGQLGHDAHSMTRPRNQLIDRQNGGYYHLVSRCVRRAWLSGRDPVTGKDFSHRRDWIEARLLALSDIFTVDVYGYAVMSNHYHIVIHYRPQQGLLWSDEEVARRWLTLFPPKHPEAVEERIRFLSSDGQRIGQLRERLSDLSWYMQCLNAPIARRSNLEDGCTGRFWDGRFYSKALPDERAVYACMAYADLNPMRAGKTDRIDAPEHTSLRRRLDEARRTPDVVDAPLAPLAFHASRDRITTSGPSALAMNLRSYLVLVEWMSTCLSNAADNEPREQGLPPPTLSNPRSWLAALNSLRRRTGLQCGVPRGMLTFGT